MRENSTEDAGEGVSEGIAKLRLSSSEQLAPDENPGLQGKIMGTTPTDLQPEESTAMPSGEAEDEKTFELLELLDQYENLANGTWREHFVEGFFSLSRANFHAPRRYGIDYFDMRPAVACTTVKVTGDCFSLVDDLRDLVKESSRESKPEASERSAAEGNDRSAAVEEEKASSTDSCRPPESSATARNDGRASTNGLRKRGQREKAKKSAEVEPTSPITAGWTSEADREGDDSSRLPRDPVLQFGGLVPSQLREAQTYFRTALQESLHLLHLQQKILVLLDELQTANF